MSPIANTPGWLQPPAEQAGLGRYVQVLRERARLIATIVALTLAGAVLYLLSAEKVYEAEADLRVTPASDAETVLRSLGAIAESTDPTRDVETAARLATTVDVAEQVRIELDTSESLEDLLQAATAEPVAQSNIVAITAEGSTPEEAQELANAFASGAVAERTDELHAAIEERLPVLRQRLGGSNAPGAASVADQIGLMQIYLAGDDPTLRVETEAVAPSSPASPRPALTLAGALLAGLVLGIGAAFAFQGLDPALRREEQLRARYRLPILARIPNEGGRSKETPLGPQNLSAPTLESYRTLRASVGAAQRRAGSTEALLVTGSSPSEGKTTTAINLACSLALAGSRVVLIEADLRRPAIAKTLGVGVEDGVVNVLLENASLEEALVETSTFGPNLKLLLADYEGGWIAELFSLPAAESLVEDAKQIADFVIIDSPPLAAVVDTLPLARRVDDVLIVSRLGVTRLDKLHELAELLASNDIAPLGFALVGTPRPESDYYHSESAEPPGEMRIAAAGRAPAPVRGRKRAAERTD